MKKNIELTKAEGEVMHILWSKGEALVQDLIAEMPAPKPAYNTVSTIVRILEQKGIVGHKAYGRFHRYYPLIEKEKYTRGYMKDVVHKFFGNSVPEMVSFFTQQENLSVKELETIKQLIEKELHEKQTTHLQKRRK
ncbi:MAG: BlaI/MecI/CopY family transcriptional regulator [Prevotellaceae bacterium]|jgi:predicted transcriptional regulator|nr:BlaI/MecI/CopY family transcriptional regulator [Prevotellaceae bacterium]